MLDILKERQSDLFQGLEFFKKERLFRKKATQIFTNMPKGAVQSMNECVADFETRLQLYTLLEGKPFSNDWVKTAEYLHEYAERMGNSKRNPVLAGEAEVMAGMVENEWEQEINPTWVRVKPKKGKKNGSGRSN